MAFWIWWPIVEGCAAVLRARPHARRRGWSRRRRAAFLILVVPFIGFYLMHGMLGVFGLFGSMALPRYFVCVAPMASILAILGLQRIERRRQRAKQKPLAVGVLITGILLPMILLAIVGFAPARPGKAVTELDVIAETIETRWKPADYQQRLILGHPYIMLRMNLPAGTSAGARLFSAETLSACATGTMLVTEPQLWRNEDRAKADQLHAWGWHEDEEVAEELRTMEPVWDVLMMGENPNDHAILWIKR
jgi:4-amino-4-deoxy-L-arabinose transferase-like glycosyltransferase